MKAIRPSAKAVILRGTHLLVIVKADESGEYAILPGGGQEPGEPLEAALRRECLEELGTEVETGDLLCVRDYVGRHHEFASWDSRTHALELMFACRVPDTYQPHGGHLPDQGQLDVRWIPVDRLTAARLYPAALVPWLARFVRGAADLPRYLGDVN